MLSLVEVGWCWRVLAGPGGVNVGVVGRQQLQETRSPSRRRPCMWQEDAFRQPLHTFSKLNMAPGGVIPCRALKDRPGLPCSGKASGKKPQRAAASCGRIGGECRLAMGVPLRVVCRKYFGLMIIGVGVNRPFERVLTARMDVVILPPPTAHGGGTQPVGVLFTGSVNGPGRFQSPSAESSLSWVTDHVCSPIELLELV